MRSIPFSATGRNDLAYAVTIQRGIETLRFTTHFESVVIARDVGSDLYSPSWGGRVTNMAFPSDGSPATCDVMLYACATGPVLPGDAARGALDGWPISVEQFDLGNTGAGTYDWLPSATIADVSEDADGLVTISVNGQLARAKGPLTEHYQLTCRHEHGDDGCKTAILPGEIGRNQTFIRPDISTGLLAVNDAYGRVATGSAGTVEDYANVFFQCAVSGTTDPTTAPTYDPTPGNTTVDGTATLIAVDAWLRYARGQRTGNFTIQLTALPDTRASDSTWYLLGGLYFRSGPLAGFPKRFIRAWDPGTLTLTLFEPIGVNDVPANTQLEIHAGCNLLIDGCQRFSNIVNRGAEDFVPPSNSLGLV